MNQEAEELRHREVYQCDMHGGTGAVYFDRLFLKPTIVLRNNEGDIEAYTFENYSLKGEKLIPKNPEKVDESRFHSILNSLERIASEKGI